MVGFPPLSSAMVAKIGFETNAMRTMALSPRFIPVKSNFTGSKMALSRGTSCALDGDRIQIQNKRKRYFI